MNKKMKQQMKQLKIEARNRKKLKREMTPKERFEFQELRRLEQQRLDSENVGLQNETKETHKQLGIRNSYGRFSCDNCMFMRPGDYCAIYKKRVHKSNWCFEHKKISVVIYHGGSVSPR